MCVCGVNILYIANFSSKRGSAGIQFYLILLGSLELSFQEMLEMLEKKIIRQELVKTTVFFFNFRLAKLQQQAEKRLIIKKEMRLFNCNKYIL